MYATPASRQAAIVNLIFDGSIVNLSFATTEFIKPPPVPGKIESRCLWFFNGGLIIFDYFFGDGINGARPINFYRWCLLVS